MSRTVLQSAAEATCWDCMSTKDFGYDFSAYNYKENDIPPVIARRLQQFIVLNRMLYKYFEKELSIIDKEVEKL